MSWTIAFEPRALRQLDKLDRPVAEQIRQILTERVATQDDPRKLGKAMLGKWKGL